jgi:putative ABC transport system permease protein
LLLESWLLALAATMLGLLLGVGAVAVAGRWLAQSRAFPVSSWDFTPELLWIGIVAFGVATIAALLPAWRAGRMEVAQTLAQG